MTIDRLLFAGFLAGLIAIIALAWADTYTVTLAECLTTHSHDTCYATLR